MYNSYLGSVSCTRPPAPAHFLFYRIWMRKETMMVSINKPLNRRISGSARDRGPRQRYFEYLLPCIKYKLLFKKKKKNPKNLDLTRRYKNAEIKQETNIQVGYYGMQLSHLFWYYILNRDRINFDFFLNFELF